MKKRYRVFSTFLAVGILLSSIPLQVSAVENETADTEVIETTDTEVTDIESINMESVDEELTDIEIIDTEIKEKKITDVEIMNEESIEIDTNEVEVECPEEISVLNDVQTGTVEVESIQEIEKISNESDSYKTPEEILTNCRVTITKDGGMRTEKLKQDENFVDVSVRLDDTIESCYLTIYGYAGNTQFDPDATYNKRLWSGKVTNGYEGTCIFSDRLLPLPIGYKVIACLNVPVAEDFYRPSNSQALEVVDENGSGFQDYEYPDAFIDETELEAGDTSLHISLTGDERLFEAAKKEQINITVSVAQYPEDDSFDFENNRQISLLSNLQVTEPFSGKEISFSEPLRAGYRARAIVYWSQNEKLFLAKGNDYEKIFGKPDDSVQITGAPSVEVIGEINSTDNEITLKLNGTIPQGAMLLLKRYPKGTKAFAMNQGNWVASSFDVTTGENLVRVNGTLLEDEIMVAFLQKDGNVLAQSEPVLIAAKPDFTVTCNNFITTESKNISFLVTSNDTSITNILLAALCRVDQNGKVDATDSNSYLARLFQQKPGTLNFENIMGLRKGDRLRLVLKYNNGDDIFESEDIIVTDPLEPDSLSLIEQNITTDMTSVSVSVSGCGSFRGGLLILTMGSVYTNYDADSRIQIGSQKYNGTGTYRFPVSAGQLKQGNTLQAHLYRYDMENDATAYQYGKPIIIRAASSQTKEPSIMLLTEKITAGMTTIKAKSDFEPSISNASYKLYQFTGETLDVEKDSVIAQSNTYYSGRNNVMLYCSNKLITGAKLQIEMTAGDKKAYSEVVEVQPSPDWGTPYAAFEVSAVKSDEEKVTVTIDYSEKYLSLEDDFYCDVTIYEFPGEYTDKEFEENEMWETTLATRVGQVNSRSGDVTKGKIVIPIKENVTLRPNDRLIIKLRLPHTEWEGEEVDYISASVPIIDENEEITIPRLLLYHMDEDTSLGRRLREIAKEQQIDVVDVKNNQLNQQVGYLAGIKGYEAFPDNYEGAGADVEFMLMANFSEAQLDRFLAAMTEKGVRIDHKAVTTAYNIEYAFHQLIDDIKEEHIVFQALLELDQIIKDAEKLDKSQYEFRDSWNDFVSALEKAKEVLSIDEPSLEELQTATNNLKKLYLSLMEMEEITGTAVIVITCNEDGSYDMEASVKNGAEGKNYSFEWNTGEKENVLHNVTAEDLIAKSVTVTSPNTYGRLKAQLMVPKTPDVTFLSGTDTLKVTVKSVNAEDNRPIPVSYRIGLYQNGCLLESREIEHSETTTVFTDLEADTEYTVKIYASSIVGYSDAICKTVATLSKDDVNQSGTTSEKENGSYAFAIEKDDASKKDKTEKHSNSKRKTTTETKIQNEDVGVTTVITEPPKAIQDEEVAKSTMQVEVEDNKEIRNGNTNMGNQKQAVVEDEVEKQTENSEQNAEQLEKTNQSENDSNKAAQEESFSKDYSDEAEGRKLEDENQNMIQVENENEMNHKKQIAVVIVVLILIVFCLTGIIIYKKKQSVS